MAAGGTRVQKAICRHADLGCHRKERDVNDWSEEQKPPSPARVAARAIALVGVVCRGFLEVEQDRREAETRRLHLSDWLERVGAWDELEESELSLIETPHGLLDRQGAFDATWRSEGL